MTNNSDMPFKSIFDRKPSGRLFGSIKNRKMIKVEIRKIYNINHMKAKLFILALMLMTSISSFAQSSNTPKSNGWNTIYLQWNPSSFVPDKGSSENFTGLSVGYNRAISISPSLPLYFEVGLGAQYSFCTNDITEDVANELGVTTVTVVELFRPEEKVKMFSAKLPISLAYAFRIPETTLSLIPYVGLDMRLNIMGKASLNYNLTPLGRTRLLQSGASLMEINETFKDRDYDLFDKNDMGSDAATWNRFQVGWHIGINACMDDKVIIGASYGTDFSEIAEKVKIHTTSLTLGYCF